MLAEATTLIYSASDSHRIVSPKAKAKPRQVPIAMRPLQSALIQACESIGEEELTPCHISNTVQLHRMTQDMVNVLDSEYSVPFGAYAEVNRMMDRCQEKFDKARKLAVLKEPQEVEELDRLRKRFDKKSGETRDNMRSAAQAALVKARKHRKPRSNALLFSCPPLGFLGLHHFYLGNHGMGLFSLLTCWTVVVPLFNFILFLQIMLTDDHHFDLQYNADYVYFKSLSSLV